MKKTSLLLVLLLLILKSVNSQILSVVGETEFSILPNTEIALDKIVIKSSKPLTISNNNINRVDKKNSTSSLLESVYVFDKTFSGFSGSIEVLTNSFNDNLSIGVRSFQNSPWTKIENNTSRIYSRNYIGEIPSSTSVKEIALVGKDILEEFEVVSNPIVNSNLELKVFIPCNLSITNVSGQILVNKNFTKGTHKVDLSNQARSTYLITSSKKTIKFIY